MLGTWKVGQEVKNPLPARRGRAAGIDEAFLEPFRWIKLIGYHNNVGLSFTLLPEKGCNEFITT